VTSRTAAVELDSNVMIFSSAFVVKISMSSHVSLENITQRKHRSLISTSSWCDQFWVFFFRKWEQHLSMAVCGFWSLLRNMDCRRNALAKGAALHKYCKICSNESNICNWFIHYIISCRTLSVARGISDIEDVSEVGCTRVYS